MRSGAQPAYTSPDWAIRASAFDFQLSPARPFAARYAHHANLTPMRIGIHDGLEVAIVLAGALEVDFECYNVLKGPGDASLIAMWEPHRWRVAAPGTEEVIVVFLADFIGGDILSDGAWMDIFSCPPRERHERAGPAIRESALAIGLELRSEVERKAPGWETAVRLGLTHLLFAVSRGWNTAGRPRRGRQPGCPRVARIMPALGAVHARPAERVTVAAAAAACRLSSAQFSRVFRQTMGLSFAKFRLRAHLAYAAHLLLTTDHTMNAIAAEAGFVDGSHLHRHFVERYATTPGEYRADAR